MLVAVTGVLTAQELQRVRAHLSGACWGDGRLTAGHRAAPVKSNLQVPQDDPAAQEARGIILAALERNATFISAALPHHVFPPLFNRYEPGMAFGDHVDNAVRQIPGTPHRLRTDLSATLFLSDPAQYDGGELVVDDLYGSHSVKLAAGDLVLYPASSLHRVQPVTRGARDAAFFWIQSLVRDDGARTLLYDLDAAIRDLTGQGADARNLLRLTGCYHNLLRRWAQL
ncbi:MAG TPA: Fe2+-dependent dioxygenase [Steroidobacteraceae bacterium]|jgi:PKHD-type hydroxylase|nr:Fe2+-dependent dioxygenase [Steroidobacteraceae bacterium]